MVNQIVTVAVSQIVAPTPATLQQCGALVSQGATTITPGSYSLLTQLSDLSPLLTGAAALASLTWSGGVVTATTASPHGYTNGETIDLTISGVVPSGYNGTYSCSITGASTFTYSHAGTLTTPAGTPGVWTPEDVAELQAMATSYFAQGSQNAVWVLELGKGNAADGVVALNDYITANPNSNYTSGAQGFFYAYLLPRSWSDESTYLTFLAQFQATTSKTYFFTTMTTGNYTTFTALMKCVFGLIEAPGVGNPEFTLAAPFYWYLVNRPSATNKVPPFAFTFLFGVTPYPSKGNAALLAALKLAGVNVVGTGAEGGISNAILLWGTMMDGRGATYWYSVDWIQINSQLNVANAIINGSNSRINPLYYNQQGIDRLQDVAADTFSRAVTFGLATGTVEQTALDGPDFAAQLNSGAYNGKLVVNAVPFLTYLGENPGDYKIGEYDGLSGVYVTQNGFIHVLFNIDVTDFVVQG